MNNSLFGLLHLPALPGPGDDYLPYVMWQGLPLSPLVYFDFIYQIFFLFLVLQALWPWAFKGEGLFTRDRFKNTLNNVVIGILCYVIFTVVSLVMYSLFFALKIPRLDLFELMGLNTLGRYVVGFVILDFMTFFLHYVFHKVPRLWPVHRVHHVEHYVDAFTYTKFHPIEAGAYSFLVFLSVYISGCTFLEILVFLTTAKLFAVFLHADWRLPFYIEKYLGVFIMTSGHHLSHHDKSEYYHHANYGLITTLWDRLFGCYRPPEKDARYDYGLPGYDGKKTGVWMLLMLRPHQEDPLQQNPQPHVS